MYVCWLAECRIRDMDALGLVKQITEVIKEYKYDCKVMFSSVRYPEHVKDALTLGAHNITLPWSIMKKLADNHLTKLGTDQFLSTYTADDHPGKECYLRFKPHR